MSVLGFEFALLLELLPDANICRSYSPKGLIVPKNTADPERYERYDLEEDELRNRASQYPEKVQSLNNIINNNLSEKTLTMIQNKSRLKLTLSPR